MKGSVNIKNEIYTFPFTRVEEYDEKKNQNESKFNIYQKPTDTYIKTWQLNVSNM